MRSMLHMLLNKPAKAWAHDLLAFLRDSSGYRKLAYAIERCCERRAAKLPNRRQAEDETFPRRMYEAAQKIIADFRQSHNTEALARGSLVSSNSSRPQQRIAVDLSPEFRKCAMAGTCCKWECKTCHLRLSE